MVIVGIGVDSVSISRMEDAVARMSSGALARMFTPAELAASRNRENGAAEYLATRFAAKEAVFKALAHHANGCEFDLRRIETLNHEDGCPFVNVDDYLAPILKAAGVSQVHISITTEGDFATAFAVAE